MKIISAQKLFLLFVSALIWALCLPKTPISKPFYGYPDLRFLISDKPSSVEIANKIFTVGFSLGAQIGADAIRKTNAQEAKTHNWGPLPRGVVSFYGGCAYPSRTYLDEDIVRPILWMMGKEDKYYMQGCDGSTFESIKKQHPQSEFISFENAGHCWDCKQLDGFHNRREGHTYRYNAEVHKESGNAALKFIEKFE